MNVIELTHKIIRRLKTESREIRCQWITLFNKAMLKGSGRIYFVHIRKTGGTSINNMFLSLATRNPGRLYDRLTESFDHRLIEESYVFVGWKERLINRGNYFYAFSHTPLYQLDLPPDTFTFTCFRDPVKRVISHYKMLLFYRKNEIDDPCMEKEGPWLGDSFSDFIDNMPRESLLNQLYMFSESLEIEEAITNVKTLDHWFFTREFNKGITKLNKKTGLHLKPVHVRKGRSDVEVSKSDFQKLEIKLKREYQFLDRVRDLTTTGSN